MFPHILYVFGCNVFNFFQLMQPWPTSPRPCRNACNTCNKHNAPYFGAYPCPWSRKIDMCGVLGNWVCGQELGRGQPGHASPVTIWPTCVTTATRLLRIFGIFETLGYSGYYSQVTMLVLIWFEWNFGAGSREPDISDALHLGETQLLSKSG